MTGAELLAELRDRGFSVETDDDRLMVSPRKRLTDDDRQRIRQALHELLAALREPVHILADAEVAIDCTACAHCLARGTCAQPEAARLIPAGAGFGIVWPEPGQAAGCAAFEAMPGKAAGRPYRLSRAEGDAAHAEPWDDAAIARFQARVQRIRRRGYGEQDPDDLAERLHLRDVQAERRVLCLECAFLAGSVATGWRCGNQRAADVAPEVSAELVTLMQACPGFAGAAAHEGQPTWRWS